MNGERHLSRIVPPCIASTPPRCRKAGYGRAAPLQRCVCGSPEEATPRPSRWRPRLLARPFRRHRAARGPGPLSSLPPPRRAGPQRSPRSCAPRRRRRRPGFAPGPAAPRGRPAGRPLSSLAVPVASPRPAAPAKARAGAGAAASRPGRARPGRSSGSAGRPSSTAGAPGTASTTLPRGHRHAGRRARSAGGRHPVPAVNPFLSQDPALKARRLARALDLGYGRLPPG